MNPPNTLERFSTNLAFKDGLWRSPTQSQVSYPEDGSELFAQLEETSFWFRHRNRCIVEVVKKHANKSPFFDIGGGNGIVSQALIANGIETFLLEPGVMFYNRG